MSIKGGYTQNKVDYLYVICSMICTYLPNHIHIIIVCCNDFDAASINRTRSCQDKHFHLPHSKDTIIITWIQFSILIMHGNQVTPYIDGLRVKGLVLTDWVSVLESLMYIDVTVMLYNVSLCRLSIVYLEPLIVSGYITLPDIVTLCDTSPHAGWL